ncbi:unnamed protein product [Dibothriocephalus latus]|uniref:Fibronectin type-III domain-containing protein n=1 Tax=Dibothriocephalus latus TaxID=60516 RepID=A0A3P7PF35_DIBLA|nr:unnamed protein product [Dibothriocephalus latus]
MANRGQNDHVTDVMFIKSCLSLVPGNSTWKSSKCSDYDIYTPGKCQRIDILEAPSDVQVSNVTPTALVLTWIQPLASTDNPVQYKVSLKAKCDPTIPQLTSICDRDLV